MDAEPKIEVRALRVDLDIEVREEREDIEDVRDLRREKDDPFSFAPDLRFFRILLMCFFTHAISRSSCRTRARRGAEATGACER